MKKRTRNKLLAIATAILLAAIMVVPGLGTLKAGAATKYEPVEGTSMNFTKYLVIPSDASVPTLAFSYTWETGTAVEGDADFVIWHDETEIGIVRRIDIWSVINTLDRDAI